MIRAVLFDATGTLIHLRESVGQTYARLARRHGVEIPAVRIDAAFARVFRRMPPMAFPGVAPEHIPERERHWWHALVLATFQEADATQRFTDFDQCFDQLFDYYAEPTAWELASDAYATVADLRRRGMRTGIVSNFDYRLPRILDAFGLTPLFDVVVLAADVGAAKPDSRIFTTAVQRLGVEASEAVYVGDDADDDIAGARAAGLQAIDVASLPALAAVVGLVGSQ